MTVLSQFFGGSTGASGAVGAGNFFLFGTTTSVTLPSTTKYVAYAAMGAGGAVTRTAGGTSCVSCVYACGNAGGGFSANWGEHAPGTATTVCVTIGSCGGTSCVVGLLPGNISATGGGNGVACSITGGIGSGGKINTSGGLGGAFCAAGCTDGAGGNYPAAGFIAGAGAGGMYGSGGNSVVWAGGNCCSAAYFTCCGGICCCLSCCSFSGINANPCGIGGGGMGSGGGGGGGGISTSYAVYFGGSCFGPCCPNWTGQAGVGGQNGAPSGGGPGLGGLAVGGFSVGFTTPFVQPGGNYSPPTYVDGGKKYSFALTMLSTSGGGAFNISPTDCRCASPAGFGGGGSGCDPIAQPGFGGGSGGLMSCGRIPTAPNYSAGCGGSGFVGLFVQAPPACPALCSITAPGNGFAAIEYWT